MVGWQVVNTYNTKILSLIVSLFLLCSPLALYVGGSLYNTYLLSVIQQRVAAIPPYPGAEQVEITFADEKDEDTIQEWTWRIKYQAGDQRNDLMNYYRNVLPTLGWTYETYGEEGYNKLDNYWQNGLTLTIFYSSRFEDDNSLVTVLVSYEYSTRFDLWRYRAWDN